MINDFETNADIMQAAISCGELAQRITDGYYAQRTIIEIANDPRSMLLAPAILPGHVAPLGTVNRKDGTQHIYHFTYYLAQVRTNLTLRSDLELLWFTGALITVGDALSKYNYFNRAPELELLRYLRNGVGHGNRFRIDNSKILDRFPAHNKFAHIKSDNKSEFEITTALQGKPILFDFIGPADIIDLLCSIGVYLIRMGNRQPLR